MIVKLYVNGEIKFYSSINIFFNVFNRNVESLKP